MTAPIPLFKGEAMLLSWGDTSSRGKTVTFALHPDECGDVHPFRGLGTGKTGQRFAIVAVPITDDEEVSPGAFIPKSAALASADGEGAPRINQPSPAPGETKERRPFHTLPLPQQVALRCADEAFREWIAMMEGVQSEVVDDAFAAAWVREKCDVHSRAEIKPGSLAAIAWGKLEARFLQDTGRMPAEIGQ